MKARCYLCNERIEVSSLKYFGLFYVCQDCFEILEKRQKELKQEFHENEQERNIRS